MKKMSWNKFYNWPKLGTNQIPMEEPNISPIFILFLVVVSQKKLEEIMKLSFEVISQIVNFGIHFGKKRHVKLSFFSI